LKKPPIQIALNVSGWIVFGILTLVSAAEAISTAATFFNQSLAMWGSIVLFVFWVLLELFVRFRGVE
jgi:hypothetical protein